VAVKCCVEILCERTGVKVLVAMPETSPIASNAEELSSGDSPSQSGELFDKVAEVVKVIRPAVQADNGDIFLREVDPETGVVSVELVGACITCPASSQTLKEGLERILKQRVEGVTAVQHIGEELIEAPVSRRPNQELPLIHYAGRSVPAALALIIREPSADRGFRPAGPGPEFGPVRSWRRPWPAIARS